MGFFDRFKKKESESTEPEVPASIKAASSKGVLCAPVSGKVIPMTEVPDPVFSGEVLGKGCAIWPQNDDVYAPASGLVTITMDRRVIADAGYKDCVVIAVSNTSDYSSVEMLVEPGSTVSAGDAILKVTK